VCAVAVAVTGATGFVGHALVRSLLQRDMKVFTIARGVNPTSDLQHVDVVVHLAARVHVMDETSANPLEEFRKSNVDAAVLLARQATLAGVRRFVFMSSVKVNGEETPFGRGFTELDEPSPQDAYGLSKCEAEVALRRVAAETGLEVVIIRSPLVYGPGVKANFAALIRAIMRGWPLPFGAIRNARSLVGLDNLVDFVCCCITHPAAANQTFLVSDGHDVSSAQLVCELSVAAAVRPRLWNVPAWLLKLGGTLLGKRQAVQRLCGSLQVDITKARTVLGWHPPVSIQEGFKKAVSKV
jgi:nucleoside-diphosphate-sugar epimerase